jgi:peroxiredoxin
MINKKVLLLAGLLACLAPGPSCRAIPNVPDQAAVDTNSVLIKNKTPGDRQRDAGKIGDPAPPVTVMEWIKGKPVDFRAGTNVYVLVFCTLSRANEFALTNLADLQKEYQSKGVVVVAISDDSPEQLNDFVQLKGAEINFTVAADDLARRTTTSYQQAFKQVMLPRAYVVGKDGRVLWHGHPLRDGLGLVVDDITSGRYNLEQTQKKITASEQMEKYLALARQDDTKSVKAGRMLLTIRTNDAAGLCDLASKIATDPYIEKRDVALASAALDRAEQLGATNTTDIAVARAILLFQTGKEAEGLARARQALASAQSPEARDEVQVCIHAMEARLAAAKTNQITAPAGQP